MPSTPDLPLHRLASRVRAALAGALACLASFVSAQTQSLLTNGSFETGSQPWTHNANGANPGTYAGLPGWVLGLGTAGYQYGWTRPSDFANRDGVAHYVLGGGATLSTAPNACAVVNAGEVYALSFRIGPEVGQSSRARVALRFLDAQSRLLSERADVFVLADRPVGGAPLGAYRVTGLAPAGASFAEAVIVGQTATGILLDGVALAPAAPALVGENLLEVNAELAAGFGASAASLATRTLVPCDRPGSTRAVQVKVPVRGANPWDVQLSRATLGGINAGDRLLARFWLRALRSEAETGEVAVGLVVEHRTTFEKLLDREFTAGAEWILYEYPFVATSSMAAGQVNVNLRLAALSQDLEVAGVALVNYGPTVDLSALPRTAFSYAGREPDASWRAEAAARIEAHRKGDLLVRVVDTLGRPVPGASVSVDMRRHAFRWGVALDDPLYLQDSSAADTFRRLVRENFNVAVPGNSLKWGRWRSARAEGVAVVDRARAEGLAVRGHTLIWDSWRRIPTQGWDYLPRFVYDLRAQPAEVRAACEFRIDDTLGALSGKMFAWDVLNEPFDNHDIQDLLGEDIIYDWYRRARAAAPGVELVLNEAMKLDWGPRQENIVRLAREFTARGAPLNTLGVQCHYGVILTPIPEVYRNIDRLAQTGYRVAITEFDMIGEDSALHADYLEDFITIVFSHPAVNEFTQWGFTDFIHWRSRDQAGLWDSQMNIKPAGLAYRDTVFRRFWTNAAGVTDASGEYRVRGFAGEHAVAVRVGELTRSFTVALPAESGTTLTVTVPAASLAAHWPLDEGAGASAADISPSGRHLALGSGAAWAAGMRGGALAFGGASTAGVTFASPALPAFTFSAWVRFDGSGSSSFPRLLALPGYQVLIRSGSDGRAGAVGLNATWSQRSGDWCGAAGSVRVGEWTHIAVAYDGSSAANQPVFYVNGVRQTTTTLVAPLGSPVGNLGTGWLGNRPDRARPFLGLLDEVRLHDRVLTPAEVDFVRRAP